MRVLYIAQVWPEPQSSAAGWRTLEVLASLRPWATELVVSSAQEESPYRTRLESLGYETRVFPLNDSSFDTYLTDYRPDVVIYDRFMVEEQFGGRVAEVLPDAVLVLDSIDLHSLRRAREKGVELLDVEDAVRELASISRCDLTWVVSDFEKELLVRECGIPTTQIEVSGFWVDDAELSAPRPLWEERSGFVTIGNFRHPPNADSVVFLKKEIWPLIRKQLPEAEMKVYGAYPSAEMMALNEPKQGFRVLGPVEDARGAIAQARVLLAPLRFGAGIKGKVLDAWAAGTPVVATSIAAEGMKRAGVFSGEVADSPEWFAQAAVGIHQDSVLWHRYQAKGFETLRECFDREKGAKLLRESLELAIRDRLERRKRNWIGRVLKREAHRSTLYFSRWIEEKNR